MINIIDKLPHNNLEKNFFWETAFRLRDLMDDTSSVKNILFMNYGDQHEIPPQTVIFMNADEQYRIPDEISNPNVVKIFKQYCPSVNTPKLAPMPLGVPVGFNTNAPIPIHERDIDVCFIGQLAHNRKEVEDFSKDVAGSNIQSFIGWTSGFNKGISRNAYSEIIRNSKIAICPSGTASTETFRLYEAAVSGCIILTVEQPKSWIYEDLPAFFYEGGALYPYVERILGNTKTRLMDYSDRSRLFYNERWSPRAVGERLYKDLTKDK